MVELRLAMPSSDGSPALAGEPPVAPGESAQRPDPVGREDPPGNVLENALSEGGSILVAIVSFRGLCLRFIGGGQITCA